MSKQLEAGTYVEKVIDAINNIQFHEKNCVEPGYEENDIAIGDWNEVPKEICEKLEKDGWELEFDDEWVNCENCGALVRTSGNCYGWQRSYFLSEVTGHICHVCLKENPEEYLKELEGSYRIPVIKQIRPSDFGYLLVGGGLENGIYGGQTDNPQEIAKSLKEIGVTRVLFQIDSSGPFDVHFSCYVHQTESWRIDGSVWRTLKKGDIDPAEVLKNFLSGH
jgi:hypothetical protein